MIDESVRWQGSPISQTVNVATLPQKGRTIIVQPEPEALERLAEELGVVSIANLRAEISISRWQRDGVRLAGPLVAQITQNCVVSLDPFQAEIASQVDALFVPQTSRIAKRSEQGESNEILIDPESDDAPETFVPPELDVGGVVQEFLALEVDPYPRAPGIEQTDLTDNSSAEEGEGSANPFSVLAQLNNRSNNDG